MSDIKGKTHRRAVPFIWSINTLKADLFTKSKSVRLQGAELEMTGEQLPSISKLFLQPAPVKQDSYQAVKP